MQTNLLSWLVFLILVVLFGWLFTKAYRSHNRLLRWGGMIVTALLTLTFVLIIGVSGIGLYKLYGPHTLPKSTVTIANTPQQIARGEHIAAMFCVSCHSANKQLPLSGGEEIGRKSPVPVGGFIPYNLTPGGPLKEWTDSEIFHALREGVDPQGRTLIAMSALSTRRLSDEDMQAVIAYLRSQPAIERTTPEGDSPNLLFAIFLGANLVPAPVPVTGVVTAPNKGPSLEYGQYIVSFMGCGDCHGSDLAGGRSGGLAAVGPSLRVVKGWTKDQFISTIRTGNDPGGHHLDPEHMAWNIYANMDDVELGALYLYLASLPAAQK